jgi:hypothetical protein
MGNAFPHYKTKRIASLMGIDADQLHASLIALAEIEPAFARGIDRVGLPAPRISERGYATLLRTCMPRVRFGGGSRLRSAT